jgi:peptidoglycan/LPS O-acetylase OafA/YrhL
MGYSANATLTQQSLVRSILMQMNQQTSKYLPYLDGWRGLAICFLLIGHFFPLPSINLGAAGVNLFFVLSGLLMARVLFLDEVPLPTFYSRRAARIFPAVVCFLLIIVTLYLVFDKPVKWTEVAAAGAFVNNYFPGDPGAAVMPFGHIWSLCVEEHSYILLSIVALAARRPRLVKPQWVVGVIAVSFALIGLGYWLTYSGQHFEFDRSIRSEVSAFGIFASAFLLLARRGRIIPKLWLPVVPLLLIFGFAMHWWSVPAPIRTFFGVGAFALAVNLLEGAPPLIHRALNLGPLRQLGLWSFSIYLWQQPFYLLVHREGLPPILGAGLAVITGIASFYLLESPARRYLNHKWTRHRTRDVHHDVEKSATVI